MSSSSLKFGLAALVLGAGAATQAHAQAQSSQQPGLTIYGIVDAYGQFIDGDKRMYRVQSGGLSGSRIGFRGVEDLGSGLRAFFTLESGINVDDGTNGQGAFWGRQAFVGLGSQSWGQVSLGRQYSSLYTLTGDFSEFSNTSFGASTSVIGGFGGYEPVRGSANGATGNGGPARVNNSIKYETPNFGGFKLGLLGGAGETAGGTSDNRLLDVYGRYTNGPFDAMLAYVDDEGGEALPDQHHRTAALAGGYTFGDFRVRAGYLRVDDRSADNLDGDGWWMGADWRLGRGLVKLQYVQNKPKNAGDAKTQALGVGYDYSLSKRTTLYTALTHFRNADDAGAGLGRAAFAIPTDVTSLDHNDVTEFGAGIRVAF